MNKAPIGKERLARLLARLGQPSGLCAACEHLELAESPSSVFVRCTLARSDPRYPRYPVLPVLACGGFERREPSEDFERELR